MKRMRILELLSHATIVLSGMFIVFLSIDSVNSAMGFIDSSLSKAVLLLFCLSSMATAILAIYSIRRVQRKHAKREEEE